LDVERLVREHDKAQKEAERLTHASKQQAEIAIASVRGKHEFELRVSDMMQEKLKLTQEIHLHFKRLILPLSYF